MCNSLKRNKLDVLLSTARTLQLRSPSDNVVIRNAKAQGGFALIDMIFVCGLIGLLSGIALPRLMLAKQAAGSASAIGSMRVLSSAQLTFALTCGSGFYAPKLTTLGTPPPGSNEPFVSPDLTTADSVIKSGYVIQMAAAPYSGAPSTCNGLPPNEAGQGFRAAADPTESQNVRFFGINSYGLVYEDTVSLFAPMPEVGEPSAGHPLMH
jgi:type II secretory pathway pseudopilin PulG